MTNLKPTMLIAAEIESLSADLLKVNATIDLIGKPAITKANEIAKALADAKERLASALTDEQTEARNIRLSQFSDIRVDVRSGDSLMDTGFTIHYSQMAWDMSLGETVAKPHTCNGFTNLADNAYEYLITVKPEAIPAQIMALAPGDPERAMSVYLAGKARGYFKG
ncbi:hypothetical protein ACMGDM_04360 [Sphingomonas sp. DT-51]|uniref:hypothetical protein n=1 Tax=Sphingomonas sp. DT-51 TaxID=3396165 RepID=UPI003F1D743F